MNGAPPCSDDPDGPISSTLAAEVFARLAKEPTKTPVQVVRQLATQEAPTADAVTALAGQGARSARAL